MVSLKNTIYLFLFGDAMNEKERKEFLEESNKVRRMRLSGAEAENLPYEESYYKNQLKTIAAEEAKYARAGTGLLAKLSPKRAVTIKKKLAELEGAKIEAGKRLEYIEKRKREDAEARRIIERGKRRADIDGRQNEREWNKRRAQMERESAEIRRQMERQEKTHEKWGGMRDDLRMNRLIKRRRR